MDQTSQNFSFDLELQDSNTAANALRLMKAKAGYLRKDATKIFLIMSNESEPKRTEVEQVKSRPWRLEDVLATVAIALMCLITFANVVLRYVSDVSIGWSEEVSVFLMLLLVFAGAAAAAFHDQHIRVEFLYDSKNTQTRRRLRMLSVWLTTLVLTAVALLLIKTAIGEYAYQEKVSSLDVPRWWLTLPLALLCGLGAWRAAWGGWLRRGIA